MANVFPNAPESLHVAGDEQNRERYDFSRLETVTVPIPISGEKASGINAPKVSTGLRNTRNTSKLWNNHKKSPGAGGADPFAK
jgi:hypothetical protein